MADSSTPNWTLPPTNISQTPFLQSWAGHYQPFANTMDQIQQSMMISGVFPGEMPDNTALGNTTPRYAFGRQLPGTSPYVGAQTTFMQGKGMPTGVNLGLLGLQNGIGQPPPPSGGPPYGGPQPYSLSGPPYGGGMTGGGNPNPGNPAPPPFPGGAGGPSGSVTPPSGGLLGGGTWTGGYQSPGLISGQANDSVAPPPRGGNVLQGPAPVVSPNAGARQQQLQQQGLSAIQSISDPATRYMMAMAYHISPASIGLSADQINALEQSTMGSVYNKNTGTVQKVY